MMLTEVGSEHSISAYLGDAANLIGNINEISPLTIVSGVNTFIKDTPYEIEFPIAPKSMSCRYIKSKDSLTSIPVKLDGTKATIKTSNFNQQYILYCGVVFEEEVENKDASMKFGSFTTSFTVNIENYPLVLQPSAKTNNQFEISGIATETLSKATQFQIILATHTATMNPDATCDLEVDGVISQIPIEHVSAGSDLNMIANFHLSPSTIVEGKPFSINCNKDVKLKTLIKNYDITSLATGGARTYFYANSAISVGITVAIIASTASIMSFFF